MVSFAALGLGLSSRADPGADAPAEPAAAGFKIPQSGYTYTFPADHGSHPGFRVEWWYLTGHLRSARSAPGNRRGDYGFQATFFRIATRPPSEAAPEPASADATFGSGEIHLAHMALTDVGGGRFLHQERINRKGWDAGSATGRLKLHNGNWSLEMDGASERMRLRGGIRAEAAFDLALEPAKEKVIFGRGGVSRKGADPSAASYYITFSRLRASGDLSVGEQAFRVEGEAWMDHEISSQQLGATTVGWDWASLQLDDGREVMVYRLRERGGVTSPFSTLAWVGKGGGPAQERAGTDAFTWAPRRHWHSPHTSARYPVESTLTTVDPATAQEVTFHLRPLLDDQEIHGRVGGIAYWEGACEVLDPGGKRLGRAYVELTGYDKPLSF